MCTGEKRADRSTKYVFNIRSKNDANMLEQFETFQEAADRLGVTRSKFIYIVRNADKLVVEYEDFLITKVKKLINVDTEGGGLKKYKEKENQIHITPELLEKLAPLIKQLGEAGGVQE
jgi:hypothetical protein